MTERIEQAMKSSSEATAATDGSLLKDVEKGSSTTTKISVQTDTETTASSQPPLDTPSVMVMCGDDDGHESSSSLIVFERPVDYEAPLVDSGSAGSMASATSPNPSILRKRLDRQQSDRSIRSGTSRSVTFECPPAPAGATKKSSGEDDDDDPAITPEGSLSVGPDRREDGGRASLLRDGVPQSVSMSTRWKGRLDSKTNKCFTKLFGETYSKREGTIVIIAGALLAFNSGFVNGSTLSGFLTPTRTESVSAYTTPYTLAANAVAQGEISTFGYHICFLLSYMGGSFLAGLITPRGVPFQIEPTYGPTFLIGASFLLVASILAAFEFDPTYIFFLTAAANGIQNGIASIYSANLIRCSLTGASTDVALVVAQCFRGNRQQAWKGLVLFSIIFSFWFGGFLSFYMTRKFLTYTLFFNAILFWIIGIGLIIFLVKELDISVRAAVSGSWQWKQAIGSLHESIRNHGGSGDDADALSHKSLYDMFDEIDDDGNGEIEPEELLDALLKANVKINAKGVLVLIKSADDNGDGMINREEWLKIVKRIEADAH